MTARTRWGARSGRVALDQDPPDAQRREIGGGTAGEQHPFHLLRPGPLAFHRATGHHQLARLQDVLRQHPRGGVQNGSGTAVGELAEHAGGQHGDVPAVRVARHLGGYLLPRRRIVDRARATVIAAHVLWALLLAGGLLGAGVLEARTRQRRRHQP